ARETNFVSDPSTIVALLVTCSQSNLAASDAARMHAGLPGCRAAGLRGEGGARARTCNPLPGGFGHQPLGTRTGARGASLDSGTGRDGEHPSNKSGHVPGSMA